MQDQVENGRKAPRARPITATFRAWVRDCMEILDVSALSIGRDLGLGKNTLGDFLKSEARDIHLETAHGITCRLREIAAAQGVRLPVLEVRFNA